MSYKFKLPFINNSRLCNSAKVRHHTTITTKGDADVSILLWNGTFADMQCLGLAARWRTMIVLTLFFILFHLDPYVSYTESVSGYFQFFLCMWPKVLRTTQTFLFTKSAVSVF